MPHPPAGCLPRAGMAAPSAVQTCSALQRGNCWGLGRAAARTQELSCAANRAPTRNRTLTPAATPCRSDSSEFFRWDDATYAACAARQAAAPTNADVLEMVGSFCASILCFKSGGYFTFSLADPTATDPTHDRWSAPAARAALLSDPAGTGAMRVVPPNYPRLRPQVRKGGTYLPVTLCRGCECRLAAFIRLGSPLQASASPAPSFPADRAAATPAALHGLAGVARDAGGGCGLSGAHAGAAAGGLPLAAGGWVVGGGCSCQGLLGAAAARGC